MMSRQDEDLLDLMVRIAETPEEWERIHRVLSLIGREKEAFEEAKGSSSADRSNYLEETNKTTDKNLKFSNQNNSGLNINYTSNTETGIHASSTTLSPLTVTEIVINHEGTKTEEINSSDAGWPDFQEAIVKKVKAFHSVNNAMESNLLEDDWLDPSWDRFVNNENNKHISLPETIAVEHIPDANSKELKQSVSSPQSRLFSEHKISELRLEDVVAARNHTASGRGDRLFVYHRVTTSPQERRGGGAFIAVSVVRPSNTGGDVPPSQAPTTLPPWDHLLRLQNPVKASPPKHKRKHPHWTEVLRKRSRGRRHHRPLARSHH